MKIVIDIPEDSYKATCNGHMTPSDVENVVQGIKNSTSLRDEIAESVNEIECNYIKVRIKDKNGNERYALYDKSRMLLFTGMMTVDYAKHIGLEIIESEETECDTK